MTPPPTPRPAFPYRGPLRFMEGAPSLQELVVMGTLLLAGTILILVAWRLLRGYVQGKWNGMSESSRWQLFGMGTSALAGGGLLWLLWSQLDHIAARMGVGVAVLVVLLVSEARSSIRRRG